MILRIPDQEIGPGIAVLMGIWAFIVADTIEERAVISGIPAIVFLIPVVLRSATARLVSQLGWLFYGVGGIVYLRYKGLGIR